MKYVRNGKKLITVSMIAGAAALCLTGCISFGHPTSAEDAQKKLSEVLGYEPKLIDSKVGKNEYKHFKKDYFYEFEDEQGMRFTYRSKLEPQGLDGATFFYMYYDEVFYNDRFFPFYAETMEEVCSRYGFVWSRLGNGEVRYDEFGNEIQYSDPYLWIKGYTDLEEAADLLTELLDKCRLVAPNEGVIATSPRAHRIYIECGAPESSKRVCDVWFLNQEDETSRVEVYTRLRKAYVEQVKKGSLSDDLPEGLLESTCPAVLKGRYAGRDYPLWGIKLLDDSDPEAPIYDYLLLYARPSAGEDYVYHEGYYSMDLSIQNLIAQLGGTCFFREKGVQSDMAGFDGYIGESNYFFGFLDAEQSVLIRTDEKEYRFPAVMHNPAMDQYEIHLTKEEMEEIFGIRIEYSYPESIFEVQRVDQ